MDAVIRQITNKEELIIDRIELQKVEKKMAEKQKGRILEISRIIYVVYGLASGLVQ